MSRPTSDRPTETFGRYRILGLLGQGGMASLHLAEQTGIEGFAKIVALKRVHPHLAGSAELRRMFSSEAKLAARLDHPNIVAVHELGEVDDTYFISMEYLPGEDLAAVLARASTIGQMPVSLAVSIAHSAANALHYAHELGDRDGRSLGMVHRDVTPSNIMLTYHGIPKLLDFGIAKSVGSDVSTKEGVFKGKLPYSAPEQVNGELVDRRVDVFSLGIVLWETLTGKKLFHAPTDAERIDAVRGREIPPPSLFAPHLPRLLDEVVLRALARDRDARYATAQEFHYALGEVADLVGRSTAENAAAWLEHAFGGRRAEVKRAIAQGRGVESMFAELKRMPLLMTPSPDDSSDRGSSQPRRVGGSPAPRPVWSTNAAGGSSMRPTASGSVSQSFDAPVRFTSTADLPSRAFMGSLTAGATSSNTRLLAPSGAWAPRLIAVGVAAALLGASAVLLTLGGDAAAPTVAASAWVGAIDVSSDPPDAMVFVDGQPTGQRTPARLRHLPIGRVITVRVERSGMSAAEQAVTLADAETQRVQFALVDATGRLSVVGLPPGARLYVDGRPVAGSGPFDLPLGPHQLRVESADDILWSTAVDVSSGDQQIEFGER